MFEVNPTSADDITTEEPSSSSIHDIEALLDEGKSLEDILDLDPAAAGSQSGNGSSVANAVRFSLNGGEVIPLAGFETRAAGGELFPDLPQEQTADLQVFAELSIHIADGNDGLLNSQEIQSVLIHGQATGLDAVTGSRIDIEIRNQNGLTINTHATLDENGNYQLTSDLSGFQDGDQITATATLRDNAGNELSQQDQSLVDLALQGTINIDIDDGGDGVISQNEQSVVNISGRYQGAEAPANNQIVITIEDGNGQTLSVQTTIDDEGRYTVDVNLSAFSGEINATAEAQDPAGNAIQASDNSRIDALLEGTIDITINDGGDERLNSTELENVSITGQIHSEEIQTGDIVTLLIKDDSGNQIEQQATVDNNGRYEVIADLSNFQNGDIVTAIATISDKAGNTLNTEDTSRIDAGYEGNISVTILDGGDELINIGDAQNTTISGQVNQEANASNIVQLLIQDQSGNSITTQATIDANGQYSLQQDFSSFNQGDTVTVIANSSDAAGNIISASDSSVLEAPAPLPLLQANDDENEFHGHAITGNVIGGSGADVYTGPVQISSILYRGVTIDLNTAVSNQNGTTNNGQSFTYSVSAGGQLTLNNHDELSTLTFERDGNYSFLVGTQNVENNEQISYTLEDEQGQSDAAVLTLIIPTNGADTLTGTDQAGGDNLFGLDGNDNISGLDGNDTIAGGDGADTLHGNEGNDHLLGGSGFDELHGGDGNDIIEAGNGRDEAYGGDGDDTIDGGSWHDLIYGGSGNDTLIGNTGMDIILGEDGNDNIHGGDWDDSISGGDGDDIIRGGRGLDVMLGGDGNDTFIFNQEDNVSSSQTNRDTIYSFNDSEDILNLGDLLANYDPGAGDSITDFLDIQFLNTDQMVPNTDHNNSVPGNVRPTLNNGVIDTVIRIDVDGDGSFNGNTQEIVLADVDLSSLGSTEEEILQALINNGTLVYD
ncbi:calcium-binding protein [Pseudoteredinibacter isoporae]|uniref:Uncharacterized protein n=1 Tax=Pseudoteredinibacter isoporae TaxID=570281 RepID=A0A7X0MZN0_9GAMM|nr:calcium-binding protein [Pseudoteredinibacter isoporae]MBB6523337.1 hypothetical protein [Pseudoteredinibacter isoporae]NHO88851.1 calcium-binding protein [Pseudoteredinibacter isoporae]NIB24441.1 calcium-binding protein [Pseudoteredinibacter isoporae]